MAIWINRGGGEGQYEQKMLDNQVIAMGWETVPDLSPYRDRRQLEHFYRSIFPDGPDNAIAIHVGELFAFLNTALIGDLVVIPLKNQPTIAIGEIAGEYAFRPDLIEEAPHVRQVHWLATNIRRSSIDADLRGVVGARLTFSQSRKPDAERRFREIASNASAI